MHRTNYNETILQLKRCLKEGNKIDLFKQVSFIWFNNYMEKNDKIQFCKRIKIILNYKILGIAYRSTSSV